MIDVAAAVPVVKLQCLPEAVMIRLIGRKEDPSKIAEMATRALHGAPLPGFPVPLASRNEPPGSSDWYALDANNEWMFYRVKGGDFLIVYSYSRTHEHALAAILKGQYGWALQEERRE